MASMSEYLSSFPYLGLLLGYLDCDFDIHGPELSDAVAAYATECGWLYVVAARADIDRFVWTNGESLDAALTKFSPNHSQDPNDSAADFLGWLDTVLAKLQLAGSERKGA